MTGDAHHGRERTLERAVERIAQGRHTAQTAVAIGDAAGTWTWSGAANADGTTADPSAPWFLASITKLHLAVTALRLTEHGVLGLDAPMSRHLPRGLADGIHRIDGVDHTPAITVRHLLAHTSGLADYLEDRDPDHGRLYAQVVEADMHWAREDALERARRIGARFVPQDLHARRRRAHYAETNYELLAAVIEHTTGRAVHDVVRSEILAPLGLTSTWRPGHEPRPDHLAPILALQHRGRPLERPHTLASLTDLCSTSQDNLRFLRAVVAGTAFVDPATRHELSRRWNRVFFPIDYGLGVMRFRVNRLSGPGHRPVTLIGHSGTTGSWLFHCPELDLVLTGTTNQVGARSLPFRLAPRLLRAASRP